LGALADAARGADLDVVPNHRAFADAHPRAELGAIVQLGAAADPDAGTEQDPVAEPSAAPDLDLGGHPDLDDRRRRASRGVRHRVGERVGAVEVGLAGVDDQVPPRHHAAVRRPAHGDEPQPAAIGGRVVGEHGDL
jgi:hypothetical protein